MLLEANTIHLWVADESRFELAELEAQCCNWLSDSDLQRYRRLVFARHRKQLLLGRLLVRSVLSLYDDSVAPEQWVFTSNEYGKPALDATRHHQALYFNLSHSRGRLVMAAGCQDNLGVDIEWATRPRRVARIAGRFFAPDEVADLMALPEAQQLHRFYQLWTLKEAYIKACGLGLAIPLQQFSFGFARDNAIDVRFDPRLQDQARQWRFWQIDYHDQWQLALALRLNDSQCAGEFATKSIAIGEFDWAQEPLRATLEPAMISRQSSE